MNNRLTKKWLWLPLLLVFLLATATPVWADGPVTLEVIAPNQVNLGDEVSVSAVLRDSKGDPISGAIIILWTSGSFLSTGGSMELDRATTDAQGKVAFLYQARSENSVTLNLSFPGGQNHEAALGSAELQVLGSAQLYRQTAGVQVPGIGIWLLVGVLGTVWSIYFMVMVLLTFIARAGSEAPLKTGDADA